MNKTFNETLAESIRMASVKLGEDIEISIIEQLIGLVKLGIIEVAYQAPSSSFDLERTNYTLSSAVGIRFNGKERIIELEEMNEQLRHDLKLFVDAEGRQQKRAMDTEVQLESQKDAYLKCIDSQNSKLDELEKKLKVAINEANSRKELVENLADKNGIIEKKLAEAVTRIEFLGDKASENFELAVSADENLVCTQCGGLKMDGI
jgi:hypothetical protein